MATREDRDRAAEGRPGTSHHDCGECGRATLDGLAKCQHCGYSEAASDRLAITAAAAFFVLAVVGLAVGERGGATFHAIISGLVIIIISKTSRRRRS